jgi:hypothetical protein
MKTTLLIVMGLLLCQVALAESAKPPITKIVSRIVSPQIPPESFAAKPKTLYIASDTYSRSEEEPDPQQGIHGLIVVSEPDVWMINLFDHTGRHIIDPGPTFIVHHNILEREAPKEFATLEFGKEMEFMRAHKAVSLAPREVDHQQCEASEFKHETYRIVLYTTSDTHIPFQIEVHKDGKLDFAVRYISYQTNLPFDARLFKPPSGITITEEPHK